MKVIGLALIVISVPFAAAPVSPVNEAMRAQGGATARHANQRIKRPLLAQIDQSTQAPLVSNVRSGFTVEVWVGNTRIATSPPVPTSSTFTRVPLPHHLLPGQIVRAREKRGPMTSQFSDPVTVENNYVTNRYDNERSGWNPHESALTVRRVRRGFGKICEHPVNDAIRAQPLYVQDVRIPGKGKHNIVFVGTNSTDQVWAFDADSCVPNDQGLWVDGSGTPGPRRLINSGSGERAVTANDLISAWPAGSDPNCAIMLGITATPVIDRTTNTMYVVALLVKNAKTIYRLHALDITTGYDQPGSPVEISDATVQFKGTHFSVAFQGNRPGLLLDRGVLYLGFGSHCDIGAYHGWVLAYDANIPGDPMFLHQRGVFNTSPTDAQGSGVWQSGLGLAADGDGTVYLETGNGNFDPNVGSYGNTVLGLRLPPSSSVTKEMQIVSFFTPFDWNTLYNPQDQDLGSGGPMLFAQGSRRFILAGGKRPKSYLIDRDCANCSGNPNRCIPVTGNACTSDDPNLPGVAKSPVIQTLTQPQGIVAAPAHYAGPFGTHIYYGFNWSPMAAYDFQVTPPLLTSPDLTPDAAPTTSPIPTISSNGSAPGSGILWAVFHPAPTPAPQTLTLHAYDANDLQNNLIAPSSVGGWDTGGPHSGNSFQVPTVIHGKVFAGSRDRLVVFGPKPRPRGKVFAGSEDRLVVFGPKPRPHCSSLVNGGSVAFLCTKNRESAGFQLQRRQDGEWRAVTDSGATRDLPEFAYLWDYPDGDSATYRVCSTGQPDACTAEVTLRLSQLPAAGAPRSGEIDSRCGRKGKPPCFVDQPWPVSRRR
jgi:hypothetical protein